MSKKVENITYNIIMFLLIFALVISFVFTIDKLITNEPENNCPVYTKPVFDENDFLNTTYIDSCNKEYTATLNQHNNNINIGRMIFTFLLALAFAFIPIKDKIIKYAVLSGALISMFVATINAMSFLDKILPIVIIIEFLLVILIYKKTREK